MDERSRTTTDIVGGIVTLLAGAGIVTYSATATRMSASLLAWLLIGLGLGVGIFAYVRREQSGWWLRLAGGALMVMLGLIFLFQPSTARLTLTVVVGAYLVLSGGMRVVASYHTTDGRLLLSAGGIASIVMGALLFSRLGDASWEAFLGLLIGLELVIEGLTWALTGADPGVRMSAQNLMGRVVKRTNSQDAPDAALPEILPPSVDDER